MSCPQPSACQKYHQGYEQSLIFCCVSVHSKKGYVTVKSGSIFNAAYYNHHHFKHMVFISSATLHFLSPNPRAEYKHIICAELLKLLYQSKPSI